TAADRIFEKAAIRRANAPRTAAGRKPDRASDPMVGPPEPQAATTAEGEAEITAPALPPVPFSQASAAGTCLFFAGDPFGPSGMDMPVCGAPRARGRYCAFHARAAVDPEAAARLRSRGRAAA